MIERDAVKTTVGEICDINRYSYSSKDKRDYIKYFETKGITSGVFDKHLRLVPGRDKIPDRAKRIVNYNDILYSTVRPNNRHYGIVEEECSDWVVSTGFAVLSVNRKIADPYFLYYYLTQDHIVLQLQKIAEQSTTAYPAITPETLGNVEIDLPEMSVQIKIGRFLSAIEAKIKNNIRINKLISYQTQLVYSYFFHSKMPNGKMGEIVIQQTKSSIPVNKAKQVKGRYPFFTSGEAVLSWDDYLVNGTNCFLNTGGNAEVKIYVGRAAFSTDTWCITANHVGGEYLYLLLASIKKEISESYFQGTGLKHLQKKELLSRDIYIPSERESLELASVVRPSFSLFSMNFRENRWLSSYRDLILPLLINGELEID